MAAYHVEQEVMEEIVKGDIDRRIKMGGEICSMLVLEYDSCDVEQGLLTLKHRTSEIEANPAGNIHGGIITWLLDSSMGIASRGYTGYGNTVTLDIHVSFLRALHVNEDAVIKAYIVRAGRTTINVRSELLVDGEIRASADAIFFRVS